MARILAGSKTFLQHSFEESERGRTENSSRTAPTEQGFFRVGPREAKHLIIAVLRSRALYRSVVWFTSSNFSKVQRLLHNMHAEANRMILGAFKTSPTDLMAQDTNLTPFMIAAVRLHHMYFHKRMTAPDDHTTKVILKHKVMKTTLTHRSPTFNMIRLEDLVAQHSAQCEIIHPFPSPPWEQPMGLMTNLDLDRTEAKEQVQRQVEEEEENGALIIFTDGSLMEEGGGAAEFSKVESRSLSCGSRGITNN